ncbi:bacteriohemerythrin [Desulfosediminicola flagellatus]|uniref:bacteriohemerythrin n=1 Tax=Desulfosediminicola flagellatus TaxID=2569541 RepID=UPI0010AC7791|nr:bacteriohemerythrin [Desulfosediminicola flagellatus]
MEIITWTKSFSVGVKEMDDQHKKLIAMINRLIEEQHTLTEPETIAELLTGMTDYALEHFRAEEYLMSEYGYENQARQVKSHEEFIARTMDFMSSTEIGPNILSKALLEYLKSWLVGHILNEDMQYKAFFAHKGVS